MKIRPVILCGGQGTRLWPISRTNYPKQFIPVINGKSLFDLTINRIKKIKNASKPIIITNESYKFLVLDALNEQNLKATIILEPSGQNTAPAIYIVSKIIHPNDMLIIMPSDHYIAKEQIFLKTLNNVLSQKIRDNWITFGVTPNFPSTSYGYIKLKNKNSNNILYEVDGFFEKPNLKKANEFFSKKYLWNSGIYIGNASLISKSIEEKASLVSKTCNNVLKHKSYIELEDQFSFNSELFKKIPSVSIDKAVIEKIDNIYCCPVKCDWNDVGSWEKYFECFPQKSNLRKIVQVKSNNNLIKSEDRLIATIGVNDLIIVDSKDSLLIAKKGLHENMRELTSILKSKNFDEFNNNIFEKRPWGKFKNLYISKHFKIKKITLNPKSKISKQFHNFRSEHWFITKGRGEVFKNDKIIKIKKGESIDIPKKCIHYIENKTIHSLSFIEIQMGSYFGEDDIFRIDDIYGRK